MRANEWSKAGLIDFVNQVADLHDKGFLPFAVHLPGGNEEQLIDIFSGISESDYVLSTHRNWYHALLHGIPKEVLLEKIKSARSMFVYDRSRNFLVSAIIGGTPAIAVGIGLAIKRKNSQQRVWCFVGDGIEDTGHFAESVRYVDGFDLPVTFVIEDDGMAVEASKELRWGTNRDLIWPACVKRYKYKKSKPHIRTGNFADLETMKKTKKKPEYYFPKHDPVVYSSKDQAESQLSFKEAITQSMTKIGEAGGIFIGYSLVPGDAMGTLVNVPINQKIETPVAENLMVGMGIGMSLEGFIPVVYFERHDFMLVAADAIVNHLAKMKRISHGEFNPKVILKTVVDDGGLFYSGPTHSQNFTSEFKSMVDFPILVPNNSSEVLKMYEFALNCEGPVMIVEKKSLF